MDKAHLKKTWEKALKALGKQDFRTALSLLQKIQKAIPVDADVQFALAEAYAGLGRLPAAVRECKTGVQKNPGLIEGRIHLGRLCLANNDGQQALDVFKQTADLQAENLHALVGRAEAHAMLEDFEAAEADFKQALSISTGNVEIIIALARTQDASGSTDRAEATLRQACEAFPDEVALWLSLGFALRGWDRMEEAKATCEQARARHPDSEELLAQAADLAYEMRDLDEAVALYQKLLESHADNPMIQNDLAQALASLGHHDQAEEIFRTLTGRFPFFTKPWLNIALGKRFVEGDVDIKRMQALDKRPQLSPDQAVHLHFALGKAFDDVGRFDQAFRYYQRGNQQHRSQIEFDGSAIEAQFHRLTSVFSQDQLSRLKASGHSSRKPLFILGMPRSGTTLLEQVLCAHPDVGTAGELRALSQAARQFAARSSDPWPECVTQMSESDVEEAAGRYLAALEAKQRNKRFVIDKMPQNFIHAGLAAALFPDAVLIHCLRNPMDTCLSTYFQMFPAGMDFAYDLGELARYYQCYQNLMTHWKSVLGDRLLDVHYEELVSDPKAALRPVLSALNLVWDDALLHHEDHVGRVDTLSLYQVRQPLHARSTERWRRYEKHLGGLAPVLGTPATRE